MKKPARKGKPVGTPAPKLEPPRIERIPPSRMAIWPPPADQFEVNRRVFILAGVIMGLLFLLAGRLWQLQFFRGGEYRRLSDENRLRLIRVMGPRGRILDRNGRLLAGTRPSFDLILDSALPLAKSQTGPRLANLLAVSLEELSSAHPPSGYQPVVVKRDLEPAEVACVEEARVDLPGASIMAAPMRDYLNGAYLSHVLGYLGEISQGELEQWEEMGYWPGDMVGKAGVERIFEKALRGKDGGEQVVVDAQERRVAVLGQRDSTPGLDLVLTIDDTVQRIVEEEMGERRGAVVLLEPATGDILASVSRPGFDPRLFAGGISVDDWTHLNSNPDKPLINRAIQGCYAPGSVFKLVVATAALEEHKLSPRDTFTCAGTYRIGRPKRCWNLSGHGTLDFERGIINSCDIFFYQLGLKVGPEAIAQYARLYGFGQKTGVDLPGEERGVITPFPGMKEPWYPGDTANIAIGQGKIAATPIQVVSAFSALANGGKLLKPIIVKRVVGSDGQVKMEQAPQLVRDLELESRTEKFLKQALEKVVSEGTGRRARVEGLRVAGKTGTAQNPHGEDHAWFVAFAPVDEPKVAIVALIENAGGGGAVAGPIVGKILARMKEVGWFGPLPEVVPQVAARRGGGDALRSM